MCENKTKYKQRHNKKKLALTTRMGKKKKNPPKKLMSTKLHLNTLTIHFCHYGQIDHSSSSSSLSSPTTTE